MGVRVGVHLKADGTTDSSGDRSRDGKPTSVESHVPAAAVADQLIAGAIARVVHVTVVAAHPAGVCPRAADPDYPSPSNRGLSALTDTLVSDTGLTSSRGV